MTSISSTEAPAAMAPTGYAEFLTQLLSQREQFFTEVAERVGLRAKLGYALLTLIVFCGFYGAVAGAYAGSLQALSAAIKLPLLFLGTLAICFPGFFLIQVLVGSRLGLSQVLALVLSALALSAVLLAAVVPVAAFFLLTGANYYFLTLLHVVLVLAAGLAGMAVLHEGLEFACEQRGIYPRKAMTIMKVWAVLFAFVGVQMAWNLQPFVGDRGKPFQMFRHYEGNFYTAIIYSLEELAGIRRSDRPASATPGMPATPATPATPGTRLDTNGRPVDPDINSRRLPPLPAAADSSASGTTPR